MYGGIESFLLNAFYCIDKAKYEVTFLTCGRTTYNMFRKEIISLGGKVEEIPILATNYKKKYSLYKTLIKYFKRNGPDIVHINSGTLSLQLLAARAAKKSNVNSVILHSHNFLPNKTGVKQVMKEPIKKYLSHYGDALLACSTGAAKWMFPKKLVIQGKVTVIPNGVDTKRFLYSEEKRKHFRTELNVKDELLVGNIGRFQGQKNHTFMIRIMQEVIENNPEAKLLLVGEGDLKAHIIDLVESNNLQNNVIFLGERKDMDAFLSAIDVFILPSLYEGLPIASVEAQASGVKTLLSNTITKEANISGSVIYLPINDTDAESLWASEICKENKRDRYLENKKVFDAGFDVHSCYKRMIEIYGKETVNVNNK